jgi:hypothetical protein
LEDTRQSQGGDYYCDSQSPYVSFMITPHTSTSFDPRHWKNPQQFDPERYRSVPTSAQIDENKCRQIGFPNCPFDITTLPVGDGRKAGLTNSGFGTVFGVADGKPLPVCDYAGFAPFGFGYRLSRRAADDRGLRGFPSQGVARQDRLPKAQPAQSGKGPGRAWLSNRRRYRIYHTGLSCERPV